MKGIISRGKKSLGTVTFLKMARITALLHVRKLWNNNCSTVFNGRGNVYPGCLLPAFLIRPIVIIVRPDEERWHDTRKRNRQRHYFIYWITRRSIATRHNTRLHAFWSRSTRWKSWRRTRSLVSFWLPLVHQIVTQAGTVKLFRGTILQSLYAPFEIKWNFFVQFLKGGVTDGR